MVIAIKIPSTILEAWQIIIIVFGLYVLIIMLVRKEKVKKAPIFKKVKKYLGTQGAYAFFITLVVLIIAMSVVKYLK